MGTTSLSGWAVCWFLIGFTILGTAAIGGGILSVIAALAVIGFSCALFKAARAKESS